MNNVKIENHGVIPKEEEQATPEELYGRLIDKIKHYHPSADELHMIEKAYNFAKISTVTRNVNPESLISYILFILPLFWQTWNWTRNP